MVIRKNVNAFLDRINAQQEVLTVYCGTWLRNDSHAAYKIFSPTDSVNWRARTRVKVESYVRPMHTSTSEIVLNLNLWNQTTLGKQTTWFWFRTVSDANAYVLYTQEIPS